MRQLQFYSDKYFVKKNHNPVTSCTLAILIALKKTNKPTQQKNNNQQTKHRKHCCFKTIRTG